MLKDRELPRDPIKKGDQEHRDDYLQPTSQFDYPPTFTAPEYTLVKRADHLGNSSFIVMFRDSKGAANIIVIVGGHCTQWR